MREDVAMEHDQYRSEPVVLETERHRISGFSPKTVPSADHGPADADECDFLALTQATGDGKREVHPFLVLAKLHIVLASHARAARRRAAARTRRARRGALRRPRGGLAPIQDVGDGAAASRRRAYGLASAQ